jgi:hypothetical protein
MFHPSLSDGMSAPPYNPNTCGCAQSLMIYRSRPCTGPRGVCTSWFEFGTDMTWIYHWMRRSVTWNRWRTSRLATTWWYWVATQCYGLWPFKVHLSSEYVNNVRNTHVQSAGSMRKGTIRCTQRIVVGRDTSHVSFLIVLWQTQLDPTSFRYWLQGDLFASVKISIVLTCENCSVLFLTKTTWSDFEVRWMAEMWASLC